MDNIASIPLSIPASFPFCLGKKPVEKKLNPFSRIIFSLFFTMKKRLPKYYRAENPPLIRNFNFYIPLLALLGEYRFLTSRQVLALSKTSRTNTLNKLQKLFHNGFVSRFVPAAAACVLEPRIIAHALSQKGQKLLFEADPLRWGDLYCPSLEISLEFVRHELMISDFRICLELALRKRKNADLIFWAQGRKLSRLLKKQQIAGAKIIPDGYFIIRNQKRELHYFLEADRSTMTRKRFAEKIRRYRLFFQKNRASAPKFFRVLTIANSPTRAENLRQITISNDTQAQKGSHRFWYGSETGYTLENPGKILKHILKIGHAEAICKMSLLS